MRRLEQCTFVSAAGVRCTERGFLELDHRTPVRAALAELRSRSSRCSDGPLGSAISFVDGWSTSRERRFPASILG